MRRFVFVIAALGVLGGLGGCDEITEFIDSISDGAPCVADGACLGGKCLTDDLGYPGGYCTSLSCETNGCGGWGSECFRTEIAGSDVTACYQLCNYDGTCDRADEGYRCVQLNDSPVCLPPTASNAPVQGAIGSACSTNSQCNGDDAVCDSSFFGGYCTRYDCTSNEDCLGSNPCVVLNPDAAPEEQRSACLQACADGDDCRFGFGCQSFNGEDVCLEGETTVVRNPDGANDGAECVASLNCKGGTCIREQEQEGGDVAYPGGYCTTRDCSTNDDCNGGICVSRARSTTCLEACESSSDCRQGYECRETPEGSVCDSAVEYIAPTADDNDFQVVCQSNKTLSFSIPDGALGFYITPFTQTGAKVTPQTLTKPDGSTLNIPNDYKFLAVNPEILGSMAPLLFPASDASRFANAFGGGDYSLTVSTSAPEVCYYVIPKTEEGRTLDINFYFVGTQVDAAAARNSQDVAAVMRVVQNIYSSMGVTARVANYFDANATVTQQYRILRDFYDVFDLVATSTDPGDTVDEKLSVNVFLIEDFNISEAPGLLGVSTGIPGVSGIHGSSGSGLVFSAKSLGRDNPQLGQTMAHEIGHFLGLRHTTEHGGSAHDPITDTPECLIPDLASLCGDSTNFMFAFSLGSGQTRATQGQAFVVRRSALVK